MEEAVQWAHSGQCIVYPTSTLPALGCIPESGALENLFGVKKRAPNMPVSIGVVDLDQARKLVQVPDEAVVVTDPRVALLERVDFPHAARPVDCVAAEPDELVADLDAVRHASVRGAGSRYRRDSAVCPQERVTARQRGRDP